MPVDPKVMEAAYDLLNSIWNDLHNAVVSLDLAAVVVSPGIARDLESLLRRVEAEQQRLLRLIIQAKKD